MSRPRTGRSDLVVFSHLRWTFVWQRPQHLISRLARSHRTWFVEEAVRSDVPEPRLAVEEHGAVRRVWLELPGGPAEAFSDKVDTRVGFEDPEAAAYGEAVAELLGPATSRTAWLYTPVALPLAQAVGGDLLVYDVMDDLAAFKGASPEQGRRRREALEAADLVFTGGRSLHAAVTDAAPGRAHLFPSGVEPEHYARAKAARGRRQRPVAGYVGVIDERIDLELVADLARRLPDWTIEMVGPVVKIDPASLPTAANLAYPGMQPYERLPEVMGGFDVALMPFALNEATRAISPTKTLEYLAAGLPVVSTPVPDVVADHAAVVSIQDDAAGFAAACRAVLQDSPSEREARVRPLLRAQHWDAIAARMSGLMDESRRGAAVPPSSSRFAAPSAGPDAARVA